MQVLRNSSGYLLKLLPRFSDAYKVMDVLAEHEQWSRSEITKLQLDKINKIWHHAITHVPYYRELFRERNLPREFESLSEYVSSLPVLEKTTVRSGMLLSEIPRPGSWHYTSGSTGTPLAFYREREAELEMMHCQYRYRALWGVDIFDRMVWFGQITYFPPGFLRWVAKLREPVEDFLTNRVRFPADRLGKTHLRRYLQEIKNFNPVLIYGNCSAIYLLALEALESGTSIDSLELVVLTQELVPDFVREIVKRAFQTNVIAEYGAAECHVIAYEDDQRLLRVREDLVAVETLPTEDTDYRVIISVLNNPSFPLLRYDIGDVTEKPITETDSGFAVLGSIKGRVVDSLISTSGQPVRFDTDMLSGYSSVRRFRVHQFSDGRVLLWVEVDSLERNIDFGSIQKKLGALLGGQTVEVRVTNSLPPTSAGKHRWVISDLAAVRGQKGNTA